jgi:hypothetical protein
MRFHRIIAAAAFGAAVLIGGEAGAFEMTQIGGTNADGSAKYQDPDEQQLTGPLGSTQYQQDSDSTKSSQNTGFQWSMQQSQSAIGPASGFNNPLLRDRN